MLLFVFLCLIACSFAKPPPHPLSDEFIDIVNQKAKTWTAGRNFHPLTPMSQIRGLLGLKLEAFKNSTFVPNLIEPRTDDDIPATFDAREKWPKCPSIGEIRDQGLCGSCWAFGAVEAMTDRTCIHSNATIQFHYSATDLMSCCKSCGNGCYGGLPNKAWEYWVKEGISTGGQYNSFQGCKPYPFHHGEPIKKNPECEKKCEKEYSVSYNQDKRYGKISYRVPNNVKSIQREIMTNGPVEAGYVVYEDFIIYTHGVYRYVHGKALGGHAVRILGWGVENAVPYWLVANSWGVNWGGFQGYFKILRGSNDCGIEDIIFAGLPKLD